MVRFQNPDWLQKMRENVNSDPELGIIGTHFNAVVSITVDEDRRDLHIAGGRISDIIDTQRIDSRADFGFRAPSDVWERFFEVPPPALYHSIFAMIMRVPEFRLEGDTMILAQNARALQRMMEVIQATRA